MSADDFSRPEHALVFDALVAMHNRREPIDLVAVEETLTRLGKYESIGGREGLMDLAEWGSPSTTAYYCDLVRERAIRRRLIGVASDLIRNAYDLKHPAAVLLEALDAECMKLRHDAAHDAEPLSIVLERLAGRLAVGESIVPGIKTGFVDLDSMTGGFHPGELIILGSRPGVGKSALAANILEYLAGGGHKAALFTLEMSSDEIGMRLLASRGALNLWGLRNRGASRETTERIKRARAELGKGEVWLVDVPGMRLLDLRSRARSLVERRGVELLVVDYLQLVQGERQRGDNRTQEVGSVSLGLKNLARECKVPVLAVAALRRSAWGTKETRPALESLRESGSQEQDADVVLLLHREMAAETAELIVAKQRNGPTGIVPLIWQRECVRFQSVTRTDGRDG